jgi:hypothetical protein
MITVRIDEKVKGQRLRTLWYISIYRNVNKSKLMETLTRLILRAVDKLISEAISEEVKDVLPLKLRRPKGGK